MAKKGKIYYSKVEFTDAYVAAHYSFPVMFFITDNVDQIKTQIAYDELGVKSISSFTSPDALDEILGNVTYKVDVISSNGTTFRGDVISTTLTARVFRGRDDVTDLIPQSQFTWWKKSHDEVADRQWNLLYAGFHSNVLSIGGDDFDIKGVFNCDVIINY